ncbi:MAG: transglutaminase family protein [Actinomycetota bacterium]|nr:transglutaminase family protein [Actinomycetota bacterium]
MTWRISTRHISTYEYVSPVVASYNEARMSPVSSDAQTVLESSFAVHPAAPVLRYNDYWGTLVHAFDLHEAHERLRIASQSVVETTPSRPLDTQVSWSEIRRAEVAALFCELLVPTRYVPDNPELVELAEHFATLSSPTEAVVQVCDFLRSELRYLPGSTSVATAADTAWSQRSGVCQDFAHLSLAVLRNLGIPGRYVSGYLFPLEDATVGESRDGASHAWIEVWLGGWYAVDPTNGVAVGERHITVARGRDYADVKPFHGIYHGGSLLSLEVTVELRRMA